jgi:hypothetical protein
MLAKASIHRGAQPCRRRLWLNDLPADYGLAD